MPPASERSATAYIALGSNLGDREAYLLAALESLAMLGTVSAISSFYETDPVGEVPQAAFVNAVAELQTACPPEGLLAAMLRIEQQQGRDRNNSLPKGPRTLDLDLLSCGDVVLHTPTLTLPHPELAQRGFVLVPLAEIAPHWRHPATGKSAMQLLAELLRAEAPQHPTVRKMEMRA
ncbi:MAG: 2-amino-4-hydroxy-6-hydroxymethyldihydropteridine diphosphokinase [Acidobacteriaceae bacterium]